MSTSTVSDPSSVAKVAGYTPTVIDNTYVLYVADDTDEDLASEVIRKVKAIAIGPERMRARIKECIEQLAKIDEERSGGEPELVVLSEVVGWTASRDLSSRQYQHVLSAMLDVEENAEHLALIMECAEDLVAQALRAEVQ